MIDDIARPAVTDEQLQLGEALEHGSGKARSLLGDHDDLVVAELLDQPLRRDRLAVDGDLGVVGQHRPVAVVQGDPDVVVEDRDFFVTDTLPRSLTSPRASQITHWRLPWACTTRPNCRPGKCEAVIGTSCRSSSRMSATRVRVAIAGSTSPRLAHSSSSNSMGQ